MNIKQERNERNNKFREKESLEKKIKETKTINVNELIKEKILGREQFTTKLDIMYGNNTTNYIEINGIAINLSANFTREFCNLVDYHQGWFSRTVEFVECKIKDEFTDIANLTKEFKIWTSNYGEITVKSDYNMYLVTDNSQILIEFVRGD